MMTSMRTSHQNALDIAGTAQCPALIRKNSVTGYTSTAWNGVSSPVSGQKAAHLIEHHKAGSDHWSNGLWLRADIHQLYDNGLCVINPCTLTIHFHPTILANDNNLIAYEARPILPTRKPVNPAWLKSRWDELTWPK